VRGELPELCLEMLTWSRHREPDSGTPVLFIKVQAPASIRRLCLSRKSQLLQAGFEALSSQEEPPTGMTGSPQPVAAFSWPVSMPLSNGLSVILSFQHAASPLAVISSAVWTERSDRRSDATCMWWAWAYLRPLVLRRVAIGYRDYGLAQCLRTYDVLSK
jgi:hypothetical protein